MLPVLLVSVSNASVPKFQTEMKLMVDDLGADHLCSNIIFRTTTEEEKDNINSPLNSEGSIDGNVDCTIKLMVIVFYSANLVDSYLHQINFVQLSFLLGIWM